MNDNSQNLKDKERYERLLAQEEFIMEVTERLCEFMRTENISRSELARRLGKSKGFVSQLLGGGRNLTIRTFADVLYALEAKPVLHISELPSVETEENILWYDDESFWSACGSLCHRRDGSANTETLRVGELELEEKIISRARG